MLNQENHRHIAIWLFISCGLVFAMVVLGGVTRLTGSGLSMVNWAPIMGWLPPMTHEAWMETFAAYQLSPEYQKINTGMDLEGFKGIFWLEFLHRLLGRTIGLVFLLPFLFFWLTKRIPAGLTPQLLIMFVLGGLQGVLGWYMVKSGLVHDPHVSQYRLTAHLGAALVIHAYMFWVALGLWFQGDAASEGEDNAGGGMRVVAIFMALLIFITALSGGFVAGLDAGLVYNTFPLMDGDWMPADYHALEPMMLNFFENPAAVQWDHRVLAMLTALGVLGLWLIGWLLEFEGRLRLGLNLMLAVVGIQVILGITTLIFYVPIPLASAHQAGAVVLFTLALFNAHQWPKGF
ncbi:MAG: COX15/CtaA family protein [Magnetococcales bacterium]|nr:COX15/CtaA family protein [Magnetococcales bacterium]